MPQPDVVRAAGGVLYRHGRGGRVEVAVVHRRRHRDWSLPKGKLARGEDEISAALREIEEETGYRAEAGSFLGEARYTTTADGPPRPKVVRYWAMRVLEGRFEAGDEVDELRWLPPATARELVSYERDRELLELFEKTLGLKSVRSRTRRRGR